MCVQQRTDFQCRQNSSILEEDDIQEEMSTPDVNPGDLERSQRLAFELQKTNCLTDTENKAVVTGVGDGECKGAESEEQTPSERLAQRRTAHHREQSQ